MPGDLQVLLVPRVPRFVFGQYVSHECLEFGSVMSMHTMGQFVRHVQTELGVGNNGIVMKRIRRRVGMAAGAAAGCGRRMTQSQVNAIAVPSGGRHNSSVVGLVQLIVAGHGGRFVSGNALSGTSARSQSPTTSTLSQFIFHAVSTTTKFRNGNHVVVPRAQNGDKFHSQLMQQPRHCIGPGQCGYMPYNSQTVIVQGQ
jgi:hypothetical protein